MHTINKMQSIDANPNFIQLFHAITQNQLRDLNWNNVIVAGETIFHCREKQWNEDIKKHFLDLKDVFINVFIYGISDDDVLLDNKAQHVHHTIDVNNPYPVSMTLSETGVCLRSQSPFKTIRIINTKYDSIEQVLKSFDIGCCQQAFDGRQIHFMENNHALNPVGKSPLYEYRLIKYQQYGYPYELTYDADRIDPSLYYYHFITRYGLARLLLLSVVEKMPHIKNTIKWLKMVLDHWSDKSFNVPMVDDLTTSDSRVFEILIDHPIKFHPQKEVSQLEYDWYQNAYINDAFYELVKLVISNKDIQQSDIDIGIDHQLDFCGRSLSCLAILYDNISAFNHLSNSDVCLYALCAQYQRDAFLDTISVIPKEAQQRILLTSIVVGAQTWFYKVYESQFMEFTLTCCVVFNRPDFVDWICRSKTTFIKVSDELLKTTVRYNRLNLLSKFLQHITEVSSNVFMYAMEQYIDNDIVDLSIMKAMLTKKVILTNAIVCRLFNIDSQDLNQLNRQYLLIKEMVTTWERILDIKIKDQTEGKTMTVAMKVLDAMDKFKHKQHREKDRKKAKSCYLVLHRLKNLVSKTMENSHWDAIEGIWDRIDNAICGEDVSELHQLHEEGAFVGSRHEYMIWCVQRGKIKAFIYFFDYVCDHNIDVCNNEYGNLLHILCDANLKNSQVEIDLATILLKLGDHLLDGLNDHQLEPVYYVHNMDLLQFLMTKWHYSDVHEVLIKAITCGNCYLVKYIMEKHRDLLNKPMDDSLITPLMMSVRNKHYDVVHCLLSLNAECETTDIYGNTFCHYLAQTEPPTDFLHFVGTILKEHPVLLNKENHVGLIPFDYVVERAKHDCIAERHMPCGLTDMISLLMPIHGHRQYASIDGARRMIAFLIQQ